MWDGHNDMIMVKKDTLSVAELMTPELRLQQLEDIETFAIGTRV
jgi:hypothetical protein